MSTTDPAQCMNCGLCNGVDPVLAVVRKESASSRYKMQLAKQKKASTLFFLATDTGLQDAACPAGIALGDVFMSMRAHNVASGVTTKANEELLANFKKTGTPYADLTHEDFNDKPVW